MPFQSRHRSKRSSVTITRRSRSMSAERRTKPALDRYEPNRMFAGVFGPSVNGIGSAGGQAPARQASPGDPVSRGVDVGYRVIDEYMRQGQAFAKTIWPAGASGAAGPP